VSDTEQQQGDPVPVPDAAPVAEPEVVEPPMAFSAFAATLRPQPVRDARGRQIGLEAGGADEIWLKFLGSQHGGEKHTLTEWRALIAEYSAQPAHPAGMVD
jgi:hypothetical protein